MRLRMSAMMQKDVADGAKKSLGSPLSAGGAI